MLPKKNRLSRREIEAVRKKNLPVIQGKYFGLIYEPVGKEPKLGLIISAKIAKKAVLRNALRRRVFQAAGKVLMDKTGRFLFLAKKTAIKASEEELEKELNFFRSFV